MKVRTMEHLGIMGLAASLACGFILVGGTIAQQSGPLRPVTPPVTAASAKPAAPPGTPPPAPVKQSASPITLAPPTAPIEEIIHKFASHESAFKEARGNYT